MLVEIWHFSLSYVAKDKKKEGKKNDHRLAVELYINTSYNVKTDFELTVLKGQECLNVNLFFFNGNFKDFLDGLKVQVNANIILSYKTEPDRFKKVTR